MKQIVGNYEIVADIPPGNHNFTGNSVGYKNIVKHVFPSPTVNRALIDIGFGVGDLGQIVKRDPDTSHWHVDGIEGFHDACCNVDLFQRGYYRNIWHGLAQEIPPDELRAYDLICLFDVIEHLDPPAARALFSTLLSALGEHSRLVVSTPLWFWPQSQLNPGDLEEHRFGIPARSMLLLDPLMYFINSRFLVGTFVFSSKSLARLDHFEPTTDRAFDFAAGMAHLESLGRRADDVLYYVR